MTVLKYFPCCYCKNFFENMNVNETVNEGTEIGHARGLGLASCIEWNEDYENYVLECFYGSKFCWSAFFIKDKRRLEGLRSEGDIFNYFCDYCIHKLEEKKKIKRIVFYYHPNPLVPLFNL